MISDAQMHKKLNLVRIQTAAMLEKEEVREGVSLLTETEILHR